MAYRIGKTFTFDAAHFLSYHDGKCKGMHGHTYRVEVTLEGEPWPVAEGQPESGMIIDFGKVKKVWKEFVEADTDHKVLNYSLDTYPTAEHLSYYIFSLFVRGLPSDVKVVSVKVWETPDSWAEYVE